MDIEVIDAKITHIKDRLKDIDSVLKKYKDLKIKEEKKIYLAALERFSEEVIESAIGINQEILKSRGKISNSYYESFLDLEIFDEFDEIFLENIAATAGFRNRLAHDYLRLDETITIKSIEKILDLYPKYLIKIRKINN